MRFRNIGLSILSISLLATSALTASAQDTTTAITYGSSVQGYLASAEATQQYTFEGTEGDVVTVNIVSDAPVAPVVQFASAQNPAEQPVLLYTGEDNTQIQRLALRASGQHSITLQTSAASANFILNLTQNQNTLDDGAQFVHLTPETQSQVFSFTGQAGQSVTLNLQRVMPQLMQMRLGGNPPAQTPEGQPPQGMIMGAGTAAVSVTQNGSVLAQAVEEPGDLMADMPVAGEPVMIQPGQNPPAAGQSAPLPQDGIPIEAPKTTLEFVVPVNGIVEVTVAVNNFAELPADATVEIPQVIERQVYITPAS